MTDKSKMRFETPEDWAEWRKQIQQYVDEGLITPDRAAMWNRWADEKRLPATVFGPPAVNRDGRDPLDSPEDWLDYCRMAKGSIQRQLAEGRITPARAAELERQADQKIAEAEEDVARARATRKYAKEE
jgi:hypothetical protein